MHPTDSAVPDDIAAWRASHARDGAANLREMRSRAAQAAASCGAYVRVMEPSASSSGVLAGVPFAVKDNIVVAGAPTTAGSLALDDLLLSPTASVVRTLAAAGATVVGKANMHELALGVTSDNAGYGAVSDPRHPGRSAGGSSGGSAAAIAAGSAAFSLGTDTGGSMTIPASFCGVVGMRPTHGRYAGDGVLMISQSRDTIGVMAHNVGDVQFIDGLISGDTTAGSAGTRLGVPQGAYWDQIDDAVRGAAMHALDELASHGFELVEIDLSDVQARALEHRHDLVGYEAPRALDALLQASDLSIRSVAELVGEVRSPDVRAALAGFVAAPVGERRYRAALRLRRDLRAIVKHRVLAAGVDALVYPSTPVVAVELGADRAVVNGHESPLFETITRNTETASMLGHPMITVPAVRDPDRPPVGLTIESLPGSDRDVLATAVEIERVLRAGGSRRMPEAAS